MLRQHQTWYIQVRRVFVSKQECSLFFSTEIIKQSNVHGKISVNRQSTVDNRIHRGDNGESILRQRNTKMGNFNERQSRCEKTRV